MRSYFSRRTYQAHQVRRFAVYALGAVSFCAVLLVLHGYLSTPHIPSQYEALHAPGAAHPVLPLQQAHTHPLHNAPPRHHPKTKVSRTTGWRFATPADELGALIGFMAAFASNSLPAHVDPQQPLDPDLVLGFDARDENMRDEVREAIREAWRVNPVVVLSETGSPPASREAKDMITSLNLYPDPTIFEVDQRDDADIVRPMLQRLTGADLFPIVIIGGTPVRSIAELRRMRETTALNDTITAAGAKINGKRKKHGRKH
ncbi:hypothetical protein AURDEDRAFT_75963 [Auricularia subglabra TFB-10046 SS5]|uniref:Uncharacterized protein n=1 Tax=Auricularia subglabra (strain TFB-10046 / SS5) TaxID=717982 RepID=J0LDJ1_AURST|nr:hypothetical protein AURDEDRAFT_75963 [Auricularia subglabra TFB-10046 SS5]